MWGTPQPWREPKDEPSHVGESGPEVVAPIDDVKPAKAKPPKPPKDEPEPEAD